MKKVNLKGENKRTRQRERRKWERERKKKAWGIRKGMRITSDNFWEEIFIESMWSKKYESPIAFNVFFFLRRYFFLFRLFFSSLQDLSLCLIFFLFLNLPFFLYPSCLELRSAREMREYLRLHWFLAGFFRLKIWKNSLKGTEPSFYCRRKDKESYNEEVYQKVFLYQIKRSWYMILEG